MTEHETLQIQQSDTSLVKISLSSRLDIQTVPKIWKTCFKLQSQYQPNQFTINAENLTFCDSSGVALFEALEEKQKAQQKNFEVHGLSKEAQQLMRGIEQPAVTFTQTRETQSKNLCVRLGKFCIDVLKNIHENIIFIGNVCYRFVEIFIKHKGVRWKDFWLALEDVGPRALFIIALIGFLIGLISTFQSASPMGQFGAQMYIINLVGLGLTREMGPLLTAVLLAGRTASSFAAEIGTMQINQEIDALKTMGLSPIKYLAIPRILATAIMTPILNIFLILSGLIGCAIVMKTLGFNFHFFFHQLESTLKLRDFVGGAVKGFVFGLMIASIGCLHGLKTKMGPSAVGYSTTEAVVSSLIMIVIVDGIFATLYYVMGV